MFNTKADRHAPTFPDSSLVSSPGMILCCAAALCTLQLMTGVLKHSVVNAVRSDFAFI